MQGQVWVLDLFQPPAVTEKKIVVLIQRDTILIFTLDFAFFPKWSTATEYCLIHLLILSFFLLSHTASVENTSIQNSHLKVNTLALSISRNSWKKRPDVSGEGLLRIYVGE